MRMVRTIGVFVALTLFAAGSAFARQTQEFKKGWIDVNFGAAVSGSDAEVFTFTDTVFSETAGLAAHLKIVGPVGGHRPGDGPSLLVEHRRQFLLPRRFKDEIHLAFNQVIRYVKNCRALLARSRADARFQLIH